MKAKIRYYWVDDGGIERITKDRPMLAGEYTLVAIVEVEERKDKTIEERKDKTNGTHDISPNRS